MLGVPRFSPGIVLEGGSIDVNGRGTLLTTESCLLNPNRNPHLAAAQIEQYLRDYLGVRNVLWLGDGIAGDDTDGHVDDLARFVDAGTVVTVLEEDPRDANYDPLQRQLPAAAGDARPAGAPPAGRHAADAGAAVLSRTPGCRRATRTSTSAMRAVLVPTFGEPQRRRGAGDPAGALPDAGASSESTRSTWSGASGLSTASPSSSRWMGRRRRKGEHMSLITVHKILISTAVVFFLFYGLWELDGARSGDGAAAWCAASLRWPSRSASRSTCVP